MVFQGVMGGETAFGGKEVVVIMGRTAGRAHKEYKLLAANKTSTLEKEMQTRPKQGTSTKDKRSSSPRSVAGRSA